MLWTLPHGWPVSCSSLEHVDLCSTCSQRFTPEPSCDANIFKLTSTLLRGSAQCPAVLADLLLLICTVKFPTGTITQNSDAVNSQSGKQRRAEHGRVLFSALSYVFSCLLPALALGRSGHILYPSHLLSLT